MKKNKNNQSVSYDRNRKEADFIYNLSVIHTAEAEEALSCMSDMAHCLCIEAVERAHDDGLDTVFDNKFLNLMYHAFRKLALGCHRGKAENFNSKVLKVLKGGSLREFNRRVELRISFDKSHGYREIADLIVESADEAADHLWSMITKEQKPLKS